MSLNITKSVSAAWSLLSAVALIHVGGAAGASPAGDLQQQTRDLLAGRIAMQSTPRSDRPDGKTSPPAVDTQEFAKRLLLGVAGSRIPGTESIPQSGGPSRSGSSHGQKGPLAHADTQATVRKLLLGERNTTAEGS